MIASHATIHSYSAAAKRQQCHSSSWHITTTAYIVIASSTLRHRTAHLMQHATITQRQRSDNAATTQRQRIVDAAPSQQQCNHSHRPPLTYGSGHCKKRGRHALQCHLQLHPMHDSCNIRCYQKTERQLRGSPHSHALDPQRQQRSSEASALTRLLAHLQHRHSSKCERRPDQGPPRG